MIVGRATFDARKGRFTTFDLVAAGRQWGSMRRDSGVERTPGTMGVALRLADPDDPTDRVAPAFFGAYEWGR